MIMAGLIFDAKRMAYHAFPAMAPKDNFDVDDFSKILPLRSRKDLEPERIVHQDHVDPPLMPGEPGDQELATDGVG
jgi:hypothetical protein